MNNTNERPGMCFYNAFLALTTDPIYENATLVHAVVQGRGGPVEGKAYTHGWLEFANVCYDFTHKRIDCDIYPRDMYYGFGNVYEQTIARYTKAEALQQYEQFDHTGPWHKFIRNIGVHEPCRLDWMDDHVANYPPHLLPNFKDNA